MERGVGSSASGSRVRVDTAYQACVQELLSKIMNPIGNIDDEMDTTILQKDNTQDTDNVDKNLMGIVDEVINLHCEIHDEKWDATTTDETSPHETATSPSPQPVNHSVTPSPNTNKISLDTLASVAAGLHKRKRVDNDDVNDNFLLHDDGPGNVNDNDIGNEDALIPEGTSTPPSSLRDDNDDFLLHDDGLGSVNDDHGLIPEGTSTPPSLPTLLPPSSLRDVDDADADDDGDILPGDDGPISDNDIDDDDGLIPEDTTDEDLCVKFALMCKKNTVLISQKKRQLHNLKLIVGERTRGTRLHCDGRPNPISKDRREEINQQIVQLVKDIVSLQEETLFTLHSNRKDHPNSLMTVKKEPVPYDNEPDANGNIMMIHSEGWVASSPGGNCGLDGVNTAIGKRHFLTVKDLDANVTRTVPLVDKALSKKLKGRFSLVKRFGPHIKTFQKLLQLTDGIYVVVVSVQKGTKQSIIGHALCYNASANYIADGSFRWAIGIDDDDRELDDIECNKYFTGLGYIKIRSVYQLKVKLNDVKRGLVAHCIDKRNPHYTKISM